MLNSTFVVVVMEPERSRALVKILQSHRFQILSAHSCGEARKILQTRSSVEVVICSVGHPDGNWCDLLKWMVDHDIRASLVVAAKHADERLWSEMLWRGVYDLAVEPFESSEVRRIVEGAARASRDDLGEVTVRQV